MAVPVPDPVYVLRGTDSGINTLCFQCSSADPDFPILYSGSSNGLIHIWNLKTRRACSSLNGHGGKSVYCVKTLPNRRNGLLSQGRDQNICLWDLSEGRNVVTETLFTDNVGFCKCSLSEVTEKRSLLATPWKGLDEVHVLELPSKTPICTLKAEADAKLGLPMSLRIWQPSAGSHPHLLAGYEDGSVVLWDLSMGRMLSRITCHQEPVMSLDFDSEKAKGVSGSSEKKLCIWSPTGLENLELQQTYQLTNPGISEVTLRQDKKILATAGWDHRIRLFGWKKLKPLAVLDYHTSTVYCVAFSDHNQPSERLMAAGSKDHRISVWHPVRHLRFSSHSLIMANIPNEKTPQWSQHHGGRLDCSPKAQRHYLRLRILHRQAGGRERPSYLPLLLQRSGGYNYNIGLVVPHDNI